MQKSYLTAPEPDIRKAVAAVPGMSERQIKYVLGVLAGLTQEQAAREAGYQSSSSVVHRSVAVQRALSTIIEQYLTQDLLPLAFGVATKLLRSDTTPEGVRANLAVAIMDRAGFDAKRHQRLAESGKDVSQMSADELQASIDKIQAEIDGRMRDITPDSVPDDTQDIDLYP